jgi:hypothetical protein
MGYTFSFTVYAWFSELPACQACGKEMGEGKLGFWCQEKGWIRCQACEMETRERLARRGGRYMAAEGIHIGRPVWVNIERGVISEESGENEGSG